MKRPKSPICPVMNLGTDIVSEELAQQLEPYLGDDVAWGPVFLERDEIVGPLRFRSYVHRSERCIFLKRSPFARHRLCRCGNVLECNSNAKEAVVAYSLDDRLAYVTSMGAIVIDGTLVNDLDLARRFPLLRLWPIPIIDKPLDGDVLPGDPGWNGTLIERPIEVPDLNSPIARKWSY